MSFRNLTALQKGLVLILVPVLFEIALLAVLVSTIHSAESKLNAIDDSREAILKLQSFQNKLGIAMMTIINDNEGIQKQLEAATKIEALLSDAEGFKQLGKQQNADLKPVFAEFDKLSATMHEMVKSARGVLLDPDIPQHTRFQYVSKLEIIGTVSGLTRFIKELVRVESATAGADPAQIDSIRSVLALTLGLGVLLSFAISALLAYLFSKDIAVRLKVLTQEARTLAVGKTLSEPQAGSDEIARLEETLYLASLKLAQWRRRELAILDNAADIICSLDDKFRFLGLNSAARKILQYSPEDLLGKSIMTLVEPEKQTLFRSSFQKLAETLGSGTIESRILCGNGEFKDTVWRVKWSAQENSYFCVVRDITAQRKVEKLRQRLLAMACHDLRSPIMSAAISLELITRQNQEALPPEIASELAGAKRDCARLTELTDQLLLLEKLESGTSAMALTMVSLEDACIVARERLDRKHLDKEVSISLPEADALVMAEEEKLVLAIANLLENAVNVSPRGAEIKMLVESDNKIARLSVFDQGAPMDSTECASVFERFRANRKEPVAPAASSKVNAAQEQTKELALGLAISRAILQAHGGLVGAEPRADGNRLWLSLPIYPEAAQETLQKTLQDGQGI